MAVILDIFHTYCDWNRNENKQNSPIYSSDFSDILYCYPYTGDLLRLNLGNVLEKHLQMAVHKYEN